MKSVSSFIPRGGALGLRPSPKASRSSRWREWFGCSRSSVWTYPQRFGEVVKLNILKLTGCSAPIKGSRPRFKICPSGLKRSSGCMKAKDNILGHVGLLLLQYQTQAAKHESGGWNVQSVEDKSRQLNSKARRPQASNSMKCPVN